MNSSIDITHDVHLRSWVESANDHKHFPIQNLPLCVFSTDEKPAGGGVVIGDHVLDLAALCASELLTDDERRMLAPASGATLNAYLACSPEQRRNLRGLLSRLQSSRVDGKIQNALRRMLVAQSECTFQLPAAVGDYSDFFAGIHHAVNVTRVFRPGDPLSPNYKHVPIAYHGRSSSIRVSGTPVARPFGQSTPDGSAIPEFGPSRKLDFELELAIWIGGKNALGEPIPISKAHEHVAAFGLLNDWSARDIQAWEARPLGPFLGKNFLSSVSPFLITAEALAPFRTVQAARAPGDPLPLPYLSDPADQQQGAFDIQLEVHLSTAKMRRSGAKPVRITHASVLDLYWTPAQMVAHHTSNGCNLSPGDLFGSGTISSPTADGHGSLLELTYGGRTVELPSGEQRTFLEAGDEIVFTAWCERNGFARIGFGEVRGTVVDRPDY